MSGVSSFPRAASILWVPLCGAAAGTAFSCYHSYKLVYLMTWYMAQLDGADWSNAGSRRGRALAIGWSAAALGGGLVFGGFKAALERILQSPLRPAVPGRLEAARGGHGGSEPAAQRPPLTLRRLVTLLGPHATTHTVTEFTPVHGTQAASIFLAAMWAVMLTPVIHARAEAASVVWGPPKPKAERERALQDLRTVLKRAEMRGGGSNNGAVDSAGSGLVPARLADESRP